ncbi:MAG: hypothetical protein JW996_03415, partial [Candidatus Cloacimonetes bacterium]|nr:hypothetical protein [Candidatus Cloacimonadota bacterium]
MPRLILGESSFAIIHDNLDSEVVWRTALASSGKAFSSNTSIEAIMNGIPREFLISGYNFIVWLFLIFKPFTAYVINELLVHGVAFLGMFLLLRKHLLKDDRDLLICAGVSFTFALLPFYSMYGLTIAGQPLLIYAFLNVAERRIAITDFCIFLVYPVYSQLTLAGVFVVIALAIMAIVLMVRKKKADYLLIAVLLMLCLIYCAVEHQLIRITLSPCEPVSHRTVREVSYFGNDAISAYDTRGLFQRTFAELINSHRHRASMHRMIFVFWFIALIVQLVRIYRKRLISAYILKTIYIMGLILTISFISALFYWRELIFIKKQIPLLNSFDLQRIDGLKPLLWYIIFAMILVFYSGIKRGRIIVAVLLITQVLYSFTLKEKVFNEMAINWKLISRKVRHKQTDIMSWREFYSPGLYGEIADYIGEEQSEYRVISLGLHPAIAQYNGFFTLDSYQNNYLLCYKLEFRELIAGELEKSRRWAKWFDNWGNRCYLFASELRGRTPSYSLWTEYFLPTKEE